MEIDLDRACDEEYEERRSFEACSSDGTKIDLKVAAGFEDKFLINETSNVVSYTIKLTHRKFYTLSTFSLTKLESRY